MIGTSLRREPVTVWAAARGPLAIVGIVVALAAITAALTDRSTTGLLDPDAVDDAGSRAVVTVLRERGVTVDVVRTAAEAAGVGADSTVLVPFPQALSAGQLDAVRGSGADVVLVAPGAPVLGVLAPGVTVTTRAAAVEVRAPQCALPAAVAAGAVDAGGELYRVPPGSTGCYPDPVGDVALAQVDAGGRTVTALGAPDVLTNGALAREGNAALALRLLGQHRRLVWFAAAPEGVPVDEQRSFSELIPPGWKWAAGMLVVAVLLMVGWRARRLGRVVAEPLPVVVRASETVEGRARLYRRARARGHAADVLRAATRTRLVALTGAAAEERAALVSAVGGRSGRPFGEVDALLYGPPPVDDAAMIDMARALDAVEAEMRHS